MGSRCLYPVRIPSLATSGLITPWLECPSAPARQVDDFALTTTSLSSKHNTHVNVGRYFSASRQSGAFLLHGVAGILFSMLLSISCCVFETKGLITLRRRWFDLAQGWGHQSDKLFRVFGVQQIISTSL